MWVFLMVLISFSAVNCFVSEPVSVELQKELIEKNVWKPECPVPFERLRVVTVSYIDFEGNEHADGEILVLDLVADSMLAIFKELHFLRFPIAKIELISKYNGDDAASLAANNTSAFCYRKITGGSDLSLHGLGLAIDVNPIQNPYLGFGGPTGTKYTGIVSVLPAHGVDYLNRAFLRPGMVEPVVGIFAKHGFSDWGGSWTHGRIDYQHFAVPKDQAEKILTELVHQAAGNSVDPVRE